MALFAQAPEAFNYQAVMRDTAGEALVNSTIGLQFKLHQGTAGGAVVYSEAHSTTTDDLGLIALVVGDGTPGIGTFAAIDWSVGPYFLEVGVDLTGGNAYQGIGTSQLRSVPYALHARSADVDGSETKIIGGVNVNLTGTGTTLSPYVINANGGHYVGELFGGGVVFWVDHTRQHGLICSMMDLSQSQAWSNVTAVGIGAAAQSHWNGLGNTVAIVNQPQHTTSAAQLCLDYINSPYGTGVFTDWYLPSIGEARHLVNSMFEVQRALDTDGNPLTTALSNGPYWSSSEYSNANANSFNSTGTATDLGIKSASLYVRAVRVF